MVAKTERYHAYHTSDASGIDFSALTYFAVSVIWRGTIHPWAPGPQIDLGAVYGENIRRYLMCEAPFPEEAALIIDVARREDRLPSFFGGLMTEKYERHWRHLFFASGVIFELAVGKLIPDHLRRLCALRFHVIVSSNHDQRFRQAYRFMMDPLG